MYCLLESLAASLNPHNDHWRLRDEAANILARISRYGLLLLYSLCYPVKWSWLLSRACIRCWCVLQCWIWSCYSLQRITIVKEVFQFVLKLLLIVYAWSFYPSQFDLHACLLLCSTVLQCKLRSCFLAFSFPEPVVSSGHVVRYKLIRVSLGTRMAFLQSKFC